MRNLRTGVVLRNRWTASFGLLATAAALGMATHVATMPAAEGAVNGHPMDQWVGSSVFLLFATFIWHVAVRPSVVVEDWGLVVRNPFFVHRLPWSALDACDVDRRGVMTLKPAADEIVPFTFSGSLLSEMTGARSARRALEHIEAARSTATPGPDRHASKRFSIILGPAFVASGIAAVLAQAL